MTRFPSWYGVLTFPWLEVPYRANRMSLEAPSHRPEVRIPRALNAMKPQVSRSLIQLQIERCRIGRHLLVACQAGEANGEGVGDSEVHAGRTNRALSAIFIATNFRSAF